MNVNPGELSKRIKIVSVVFGVDSDGFPIIVSETIIHECWAKAGNTSGTELIKAGAEFVEAKTRFLIRYTSKTINEDMQVIFNGDYYNISYVNNYEYSNDYIEIFGTLRKLV